MMIWKSGNEYNYKNGSGKQLLEGPYSFRRLQKAQMDDAIIFQNFFVSV